MSKEGWWNADKEDLVELPPTNLHGSYIGLRPVNYRYPDLERVMPIQDPVGDINAKDRQVGGNHYKELAIQPGDYVVKNGIGWYEGNAIKYLTRHKAKGQRQDLLKAIHYIQLAIEEHYPEAGTGDT